MPETAKMLVLSPRHVFKHTYDLLLHDAIMGVVSYQKNETHGPEQYGCFVYVQRDWREEAVPEDLASCILLAEFQGCQWIMFDQDVDPYEGLIVWW